MTAGSTAARSVTGGRSRLLPAATVVALAAALLVYVAARAISGQLVVDGARGLTEIPAGAVVLATLVGTASAWLVTRLADRSPRPRLVATGLMAIGLLLSSAPPLLAATTASTAAWLLLMHLVVAVPLVGATWRLVGRRAAA